jgi:hypothetical protein
MIKPWRVLPESGARKMKKERLYAAIYAAALRAALENKSSLKSMSWFASSYRKKMNLKSGKKAA